MSRWWQQTRRGVGGSARCGWTGAILPRSASTGRLGGSVTVRVLPHRPGSRRAHPEGDDMSTTPDEPLRDEDLESVGGDTSGITPETDADGTDSTAGGLGDADGTDVTEGTEGDGTDGTDGGITEGGDADGTDSTDGTDGAPV